MRHEDDTDGLLLTRFEITPDATPDTLAHISQVTSLFYEPVMEQLIELDRTHQPLSPYSMYLQHHRLAAQARFITGGGRGLLRDEALVVAMESQNSKMLLHSAMDFITEAYGLAHGQHAVHESEFLRLFRRQDFEYIVSTLSERYIATVRNGLVRADGDTTQLLRASKIARMLGVALLFTQGNEIDLAETGEAIGALRATGLEEQDANIDPAVVLALHGELRRDSISGKLIQSILSGLDSEQRLAAINVVAHDVTLDTVYDNLAGIHDPPEARRQFMQAFRALAKTNLLSFCERIIAAYPDLASANDILPIDTAIEIELVKLNWEVLPIEELQQRAAAIVETASRRGFNAKSIDLARLAVLSDISRQWGIEDSYYAYGWLGSREMVIDGDQEAPDQYLLVILQEKDSDGNITAEHAVAESPIAGPHAMYVFRQDVSEGLDWREVLALPKSYARFYGARALRHVEVQGETLNQTMARKASTLLSCNATEFPHIEFTGKSVRLPRGMIPNPKPI